MNYKFVILWSEGYIIGPLLIMVANGFRVAITIINYSIISLLAVMMYAAISDIKHFSSPYWGTIFLMAGITGLIICLGWIIAYAFLRIFMKDARQRLNEFKKDGNRTQIKGNRAFPNDSGQKGI